MNGEPARAALLRIDGVVQGVGFRPYVFRLARQHELTGWVRNGGAGVEIHIEGQPAALDAFSSDLRAHPPLAAHVSAIEASAAAVGGFRAFEILDSSADARPTARISPDLPVCETCLAELADRSDRRYGHPYISCSYCGPRYSIVTSLPYDRARTTMASWPLCAACAGEYHDPADRRFHAQPIACPACGPRYRLVRAGLTVGGDFEAIQMAARLLREGGIVAVKGIGGYHLACDAANNGAVRSLRERKYRKEKPFALMARSLAGARALVELSRDAEELLGSIAHPIVLAPARVELPLVAPDCRELGVMLPYTPVHHLLFACGGPETLVMTSANHSSDPIAYDDEDALDRLAGLADAFLIGERPIARRVEDSIARDGALGPQLLRRSRGYAPGAVCRIPLSFPALALGADLKSTVTLVVGGAAYVSQHIGDLDRAPSALAFQQTVVDLLEMYDVDPTELVIAHDLHPEYRSTLYSTLWPARRRCAVQHHRAHVASVLAERGAFETRVLGIVLDGTGFGDDGAIWGGELFVGSVVGGFERVAHLRTSDLPGGDAAARNPVQAAAGFLSQLDSVPDLSAPPFCFPPRYRHAQRLIASGTRIFPTSSAGRLFDAIAALLGFTRPITFEGQAAMWLEQLAWGGQPRADSWFELRDGELDFRAALRAVIEGRLAGWPLPDLARAFHYSFARGIADAIEEFSEAHDLHVAVLSGGVFQNQMLLHDLKAMIDGSAVDLWVNRVVPPNDGGISLGQAALLMSDPLCGR